MLSYREREQARRIVKYSLALIVISVLILACSDVKVDKYAAMPVERPVVELHYHEYSSKSELRKVIGSRTAMAKWSPQDNRCDVYFMAGDFESLGHEVYHCYKGNFHPEIEHE